MSSADSSIFESTATPSNGTNPWESPKGVEAGAAVEADLKVGDSKRDAKRGIMALADQAICSGTNFLTMAMLARSLSMSVFGVFSIAFLGFQFARTIQERTLAAPYLVFTHRPDQDSRTLLGSNLVLQVGFAILTLIITVVAGLACIATGRAPELGRTLLLLGAAVPFLLLRDQLRAVSLAHFRIGTSLIMNAAVAVIQLGGIGLLFFTKNTSVPLAISVLGIACLIPTAGWYWYRPLAFDVDRQRIASDWGTFWGFSRWLVVARAFGIGGQYLVPMMVALYLNADSVGAFATCTALVGLSMMFILGLNNFAQPRTVVAFQEKGTAAMLGTVLQTVACFAVFLGGAALVLFFFGGRLLGLIYGADYEPYGTIAAMLSLGMLAVSVSIAFQNGLAAFGKPQGFLLGEISYFLTAVGLAFVLIPMWGLQGAAASLIAAGVVVSLITIATLVWLIKNDDRQSKESGLESTV